MKILVVDDEKLLVKGIKFNLENDGYEVVTGCDGMEAVELAASETPDLIVLDLMMPRLDGLEACTKIREFSQVPIIMLTAKSEDMDKLLGFEHGADDYLTKPSTFSNSRRVSGRFCAGPVRQKNRRRSRRSSAGTSRLTAAAAARFARTCRSI